MKEIYYIVKEKLLLFKCYFLKSSKFLFSLKVFSFQLEKINERNDFFFNLNVTFLVPLTLLLLFEISD